MIKKNITIKKNIMIEAVYWKIQLIMEFRAISIHLFSFDISPFIPPLFPYHNHMFIISLLTNTAHHDYHVLFHRHTLFLLFHHHDCCYCYHCYYCFSYSNTHHDYHVSATSKEASTVPALVPTMIHTMVVDHESLQNVMARIPKTTHVLVHKRYERASRMGTGSSFVVGIRIEMVVMSRIVRGKWMRGGMERGFV